jgi:DNA-binding NtrC family response regulator
MDSVKFLFGKRLLIVDDEKDVLETLVSLLEMCKIDTASSFEEAKQLLETYEYDMVVLDIMGVRGFELLEIAKSRGFPALMLTAHSLNAESLGRAARQGAAYFVPKDKINEISTYLSDVLKAKEANQNPWIRWLERLGGFFDIIFTGPKWREQQKDIMEKLKRQRYE